MLAATTGPDGVLPGRPAGRPTPAGRAAVDALELATTRRRSRSGVEATQPISGSVGVVAADRPVGRHAPALGAQTWSSTILACSSTVQRRRRPDRPAAARGPDGRAAAPVGGVRHPPATARAGPTSRRPAGQGLVGTSRASRRCPPIPTRPTTAPSRCRRSTRDDQAATSSTCPAPTTSTTLPWTQDDDVRDLATNLLLSAGLPNAYQQGILDAMHQAGIGADDPVLLVGHSQGGMEAAAILGQGSDFNDHPRRDGRVADRPGRRASPRAVHVLSLEHQGDVVPRARLRAEPATRVEQVTVTFDGTTGAHGDRGRARLRALRRRAPRWSTRRPTRASASSWRACTRPASSAARAAATSQVFQTPTGLRSRSRSPASVGNRSQDVVHELPELGEVAALDHRHDLAVLARGGVAGVPVPAVLGVEPPGVPGRAGEPLQHVERAGRL